MARTALRARTFFLKFMSWHLFLKPVRNSLFAATSMACNRQENYNAPHKMTSGEVGCNLAAMKSGMENGTGTFRYDERMAPCSWKKRPCGEGSRYHGHTECYP